jgi:hypothetical protein
MLRKTGRAVLDARCSMQVNGCALYHAITLAMTRASLIGAIAQWLPKGRAPLP